MFKDPQQLMDFLSWAKEQQILKVKVADIEVEFSPLAAVPKDFQLQELSNGGANTLADTEPGNKKEDDEALFWSSN
jgi:hypothetical protein